MCPHRRAETRMAITAVVLGGGRGTRLYPLTRCRSKPAVPLAGKFRLIDIALSNCINSGVNKIYVLTQYNSASLNQHVAQTYKFDTFSGGFVEILAAEQTLETEMWFQGTADAVRKHLPHIGRLEPSHVLILSGDALYREDYSVVLEEHLNDDAEITVCCKLVDEHQASSFGIVEIDETRRITAFREKPGPESLQTLRVDRQTLRNAGLEDVSKPFLASMGMYLFRWDVLQKVLNVTVDEDFGKQVIPRAIASHRVFAHLFAGYWEDIGTIGSFFRANLDLLNEAKTFDFYDPDFRIYTHSRFLPCSEIIDSSIERAMVAEGCLINRARIRNSIVGVRSIIGEGAVIENTILMGADYYDRGEERSDCGAKPALGIGSGTIVRNAIIDKNSRIGARCQIVNRTGIATEDAEHYSIRDGIVIIPKNAVIRDNTII
jgi:glucose-1-phosphate adenylyltransferase